MHVALLAAVSWRLLLFVSFIYLIREFLEFYGEREDVFINLRGGTGEWGTVCPKPECPLSELLLDEVLGYLVDLGILDIKVRCWDALNYRFEWLWPRLMLPGPTVPLSLLKFLWYDESNIISKEKKAPYANQKQSEKALE